MMWISFRRGTLGAGPRLSVSQVHISIIKPSLWDIMRIFHTPEIISTMKILNVFRNLIWINGNMGGGINNVYSILVWQKYDHYILKLKSSWIGSFCGYYVISPKDSFPTDIFPHQTEKSNYILGPFGRFICVTTKRIHYICLVSINIKN